MKKRNTILILGVISILIFISVQVFVLRGIWRTKQEMFDLRYKLLSQEAVSFLNRRYATDGFDTARFMIKGYTEKFVKEQLPLIENDSMLQARKQEIYGVISGILNQEQDLSEFLSSYFEIGRAHV